jgi:hypothetical protein
MNEISEVLIEKYSNVKANLIAAEVILCATGDQSIQLRTDESFISED